jgi:hypothetical protein
VNAKNLRTVFTLLGQLFIARTVLQRVAHARRDGDKLEVLDAVLNVVVLATGTIVIVRRLRRGDEA